jgi:MSHA biogenesis protein MshJ|tara:strand:+ start:1581 stop:2258 length:678 start_codon:yes stop_codon:yes gene_type:complete
MKLEQWYNIKDKAAALSLRERSILLAVGIIVIVFLWAQFFYLNFEQELKKTKQEISHFQQSQWSQKEELAKLMTSLSHDPNAALFKEQREIQEKLESLKEQIEIRLSDLIAPELMADVMRDVLSDYKGLRLISAKNLPVAPLKLTVNQKEEKKNKPEETQTVLFSHRFEMELTGDYFQTVAFLKSLESMQGFYWTMLKYEVDGYPNANITLQLSTLSLDEDWIGV